MKNTELRIGSIAKRKDTGLQILISAIKNQTVETDKGTIPIFLVEPIPLTEEWLIKLGVPDCKNDPKHYYELFDGIYWDKGTLQCGVESDYYIEVPKYVHQLQNLYFALTGEELSIS